MRRWLVDCILWHIIGLTLLHFLDGRRRPRVGKIQENKIYDSLVPKTKVG